MGNFDHYLGDILYVSVCSTKIICFTSINFRQYKAAYQNNNQHHVYFTVG